MLNFFFKSWFEKNVILVLLSYTNSEPFSAVVAILLKNMKFEVMWTICFVLHVIYTRTVIFSNHN